MTDIEKARREYLAALRAQKVAEWKAQEAHAVVMRHVADITQAKADVLAAELQLDNACKSAPASPVSGGGEPAIPEGFIPWSGGEWPYSEHCEVEYFWVDLLGRPQISHGVARYVDWSIGRCPVRGYRILSEPKTEGEGAKDESLFAHQPSPPDGQVSASERSGAGPYCKACLSPLTLMDDGTCPCCDHNYTAWGGGECPVDPDVFVDVLLRAGGGEGCPAKDIDWAHSIFHTHPNDVVFYRLQSARPRYDEDGLLVAKAPSDPVRTTEGEIGAASSEQSQSDRDILRVADPSSIEQIGEQTEPYGKAHEADVDDVAAQVGKMEKADV